MTVRTIIEWLKEKEYDFSFKGDESAKIDGFASLINYHTGKITWIKKKENYEAIQNQLDISCAVVQEGIDLDLSNQIISPNSKEVFFAILHHFWGSSYKEGFIGTGTVIAEGAEVDPTAYIGYNCSIIGNVKIGAHTVIENNVTIINKVEIGEYSIIHSGTVIGTDGFGYSFDSEGFPIKVEHFGGVIIENNVEIGSNTCIDRGTIDNTVICNNSKIDNLVHIAHNVRVGEGSLVIAGAIVCGSVDLGKESYIAPGGIVKNQLSVGEKGFVGLGAVVTKSVEPFSVVAGVPAKKIRDLKESDK